MPRIVYFGPAPAHVGSIPQFQPGEARDVNEATAKRLLGNVHFGLVEVDPEPVQEVASEKPAKAKAPAVSEGAK